MIGPDVVEALESAGTHVLAKSNVTPRVALVLGSGLGDFASRVEEPVWLDYADVPGMPRVSVEGHGGSLVLGRIGETPVVVFSGRVHLYEGRREDEVVFAVRLAARLGCESVILTNAAGAIRDGLAPGDLMLLSDHLNLTGRSPVLGEVGTALGPRFFDLTTPYDDSLRALARRVGTDRGIPLVEGVYAGLLGPSYETPAEIRMLRTLGADAVGMSTVLETIAARHVGLRVLGLSCLTNLAAGLSPTRLDHAEVKGTAALASGRFASLLEGILGASP